MASFSKRLMDANVPFKANALLAKVNNWADPHRVDKS
jgi:hypothetical protein